MIDHKNTLLFFSQNPVFPQNLDECKKQFWNSFPRAEGDLRIVQKANVILLKNFKMICDNLDVKFWLHGGSLVGGLRHSGYVPWDDDIDIAMMRDDFNKIKEYLQLSSERYEILEYYYFNLACRSYRFRRKDLESNCFVDIFVYDYYALRYNDILTDWKNLRIQKLRIKKQMNEFLLTINNRLSSNNPLYDYPELKNKLNILFDKYIEINKSDTGDYILWALDNNYENSTRYAYSHGRIFTREDIFPLKTCEYEGMTCYIPNNYEKYCYAEYGMSYLDMHPNMGSAVHWKQYFGSELQIELAKQILSEGIVEE